MNQKPREEFLSWLTVVRRFFFFFFFRSPAISQGFTTFGWDFCVCDRSFNPTIKVVTFRLRGYRRELKLGTPVVTLPGAWPYWVSARTGRPGVGMLWLGEIDILICSFCLSVAVREKMSEQTRPWDTLACCWDVKSKQPTNKHLFSTNENEEKFCFSYWRWCCWLYFVLILLLFSWSFLRVVRPPPLPPHPSPKQQQQLYWCYYELPLECVWAVSNLFFFFF